MKINLDCVRDSLIAIEDAQAIQVSPYDIVLSKSLQMRDMFSILPDYSKEDIVYTLIMLNEAGYIKASVRQIDSSIGNIEIHRITYRGHEFLEEIRDGKIWSGVKEGVSRIGSFGLSTVSDIARGLISSAVTHIIAHL